MKMPDTIDTAMFAPCGMNCMVCYKHCYHKKPCAGCLNSDKGKPEHCRKCRIKACALEKGVQYCFECAAYPCKPVKSLEKSYNIRYNTSLMENSRRVKESGLEAFMAQQKRCLPVQTAAGSFHYTTQNAVRADRSLKQRAGNKKTARPRGQSFIKIGHTG